MRRTKKIVSEYDLIKRRSKEDPGTAGDQGEESWRELLSNWLPPSYQIVTKGRILAADGTASPQVDVLVLHPFYPKALLHTKYYIAAGVAAAFECKVTLRAADIDKTIKNSVAIHACYPKQEGSPFVELCSPIVYGLFAHSHDWDGPESAAANTIDQRLWAADEKYVKHPREMLDLVCVADLACWAGSKFTWIGPFSSPGFRQYEKIYGLKGAACTNYTSFRKDSPTQTAAFAPVTATLSHLIQKLAWRDPALRGLSGYFSQASPMTGEGKVRKWDSSIYSEPIRPRVTTGILHNGCWDDWNLSF